MRANKRDIAIPTNFPHTLRCLVADPTVVDLAGVVRRAGRRRLVKTAMSLALGVTDPTVVLLLAS